ncbi:hypothetical protein [Tunturiibacter gelidoferens]|uniref:Uncharacterized protein n=1 Tax=Tunturiibacter gelidiferens TaxID=3069689 RepID=A0A9X0QJF9_9BACT|nr:hypothetical protein [Edaphobacter lichenicola]MBB5331526.1 hypothetical protein [Edaphobacter lichenicola]
MQDEQILLERPRLQAAKALVSFIDEDRDILSPNGCPYEDKGNGRRVGLKRKVAKRFFATFYTLIRSAARSTRKDGVDSEILREQVDLLGEALAKMVVELEIIKGDMPLSSPQALLFADDALQLIRELKVRDHYSSQDLNALARPFKNISLVNTGIKRRSRTPYPRKSNLRDPQNTMRCQGQSWNGLSGSH